jgi:hypothetical protein
VEDENGGAQIFFDYFQKPEQANEFKYYFLCVLHAFLQMFRIFRIYFDTQFKIVDSAWELRIEELGRVLPTRIRALKNRGAGAI